MITNQVLYQLSYRGIGEPIASPYFGVKLLNAGQLNAVCSRPGCLFRFASAMDKALSLPQDAGITQKGEAP